MRIVGGKWRGRVLSSFKGDAVRPTADKVRESLFNILQFKIIGKSYLDLFCGTGAVGIEALSRGAKRVVFNDESKESVFITKKNLNLVCAQNYEVFNLKAQDFISNCKEKFDYIFIDPPYKSEVGLLVLNSVYDMLEEGGQVIFENEKPFIHDVNGLKLVDERKYGRVFLTFFQKEKN